MALIFFALKTVVYMKGWYVCMMNTEEMVLFCIFLVILSPIAIGCIVEIIKNLIELRKAKKD